MKIENVILPLHLDDSIYDVDCSVNGVKNFATARDRDESLPPSLLLPALCHPHIHLDKAYLLTSNPSRHAEPKGTKGPEESSLPDYSDLTPQSGTFQEALSLTSKAKSRYTHSDLVLRGSQLIAESITYGVTSMRAFVEVDHVTQFKCLEAAVELKAKFASSCHVQICAFAQDPIMSGDHGEENRRLMREALDRYAEHIDVLGTTPYVETDYKTGLDNVNWAIDTALEKNLHLDFHLDYNLSTSQKPMVFDVVQMLHKAKWMEVSRGKRIVLGHCTKLTLLQDQNLQQLKDMIADLPLSFVGLPTSDLFMMGRPHEEDSSSGTRPRGTLQILHMIQEYGFDACIAVNNVGNAFTPWGSPDPLCLASLGVGIYQCGTEEDAVMLYQCVSTSATKAIGVSQLSTAEDDSRHRNTGQHRQHAPPALLLIKNEVEIAVPGIEGRIPSRQRLSTKDVVWDPPERNLRKLIMIS